MNAKELAKANKLPTMEVIKYLGLADATEELTEDQVAQIGIAMEEGELGKDTPVKPASKPPKKSKLEEEVITKEQEAEDDSDVLHFVSRVRSHSFVIGDQRVPFKDFRMVVKKGTRMHKELMKYRKPEIMLVVNHSFKEIGKKAAFRQLLNQAVFTGPHNEPALERGLAFLEAWHDAEGRATLADLINSEHGGLNAAIEFTADTKSYKSILEI